MVLFGLAAALAASACFNLGSALQALEARQAPAEESLRLRLLARLVRRRRWVAGLILGAAGFPLQVLALAHAPFVVVQPALAAGLLLLLLLGSRLLAERVRSSDAAAVVGICFGITLLGWGAPAHVEAVRGGPAPLVVLVVLGLVALVPFALRGARFDTTFVVIAGSAIGFAASNIATKLVTDDFVASRFLLTAIWVAVAAALGIAATATEMSALQRRAATIVVPISFGLQTFFPILIEPLYLREDWTSAPVAGVPLIAGLVLVLAASLALTRSPAVSEFAAA